MQSALKKVFRIGAPWDYLWYQANNSLRKVI